MPTRGIRGATTVQSNDAVDIATATQALLTEMLSANSVDTADLACAWFTTTSDLDAAFPAKAAREMGWQHVPLMDAVEIPVPGSLPRCIRVLLLWNTDAPQDAIVHVYQNKARRLRPDLTPQEKGVSK